MIELHGPQQDMQGTQKLRRQNFGIPRGCRRRERSRAGTARRALRNGIRRIAARELCQVFGGHGYFEARTLQRRFRSHTSALRRKLSHGSAQADYQIAPAGRSLQARKAKPLRIRKSLFRRNRREQIGLRLRPCGSAACQGMREGSSRGRRRSPRSVERGSELAASQRAWDEASAARASCPAGTPAESRRPCSAARKVWRY